MLSSWPSWSRFRNSWQPSAASREEHAGRGVEESCGGSDGGFEILCEPSVSSEPGEEACDDPAARQDDEPGLIRQLADDFDGDGGGCGHALMVAGAVREDAGDEGEEPFGDPQPCPAAVAILDAGPMRFDPEDAAVGIDERVSFTAFDLLASVITARTAGLRRLHALSMMAADGLASRPVRSRAAVTRAWLIRSQTQWSRHAANQRSTVLQGGRSVGICRHGHPDRMT